MIIFIGMLIHFSYGFLWFSYGFHDDPHGSWQPIGPLAASPPWARYTAAARQRVGAS